MQAFDTAFAFNHQANVEEVRIGPSGLRLCVIDEVFLDAQQVATFGRAQAYTQDHSNLYPGMRAAVPERFSTSFRRWLTLILQARGLLEDQHVIAHDQSFFAVVTTASQDLVPLQCIPHYDSTDPHLFAAVIYLCGPPFSGTSFYRHRRTGYEAITAQNVDNYRLALNNDLRTHGAPKRGYINASTAWFETIYTSELKFNRAIVYPARVLHAAKIEEPFIGPNDGSEWRLTVTALAHAAPSNQSRAD